MNGTFATKHLKVANAKPIPAKLKSHIFHLWTIIICKTKFMPKAVGKSLEEVTFCHLLYHMVPYVTVDCRSSGSFATQVDLLKYRRCILHG